MHAVTLSTCIRPCHQDYVIKIIDHVISKTSQPILCLELVGARLYFPAWRMMNTKKEDLDAEKEETSDLVDAVYEYLMKKEYPKDCTATKKRQIRKKVEKFRIEEGEFIYISNNGKV